MGARSAYRDFKSKYYNEIMDLIRVQRTKYPETKLHGYLHIGRCLVITHVLSKMHKLTYEEELKCLISIGLHDVARKNDGVDKWEKQSGEAAAKFCADNGFDQKFQKEVSDLITKKKHFNGLANNKFVVVHDADCLDIIRCCKTMDNFREKHFVSFLNKPNVRKNLIEDTRRLIQDTEEYHNYYDDVDVLASIESLIKDSYPTYFKVFSQYYKISNRNKKNKQS